MGDLFWNKIFGVLIGAVLVVLLITELGHMLVPSHAAEELTAENTAYPVDWAAIESGAGATVVEEEPVDFAVLLAAADAGNGERVARRCAACHTFEEGGANGVGPNLWGVVGATIASHDGFNYSAALQGLGGEWTYEALNHFIESPNSYAPGTAMSFRGLSDEEARADLVAYLRSLSANPLPLPEPPAPEETMEEASGEMMDDAAAMADEAATVPATEIEEEAPAEALEDDTDQE